jgi:hypothetical protein
MKPFELINYNFDEQRFDVRINHPIKNGYFIVRDIDLDTNLEYDDEGRPMMGRSVLVDKDALEQEKLEKACQRLQVAFAELQ